MLKNLLTGICAIAGAVSFSYLNAGSTNTYTRGSYAFLAKADGNCQHCSDLNCTSTNKNIFCTDDVGSCGEVTGNGGCS